MISWIKANVKFGVGLAIVAGLLFVVLLIARFVASKDRMIADLITKLATSEQTLEIEKGLYAKKTAEVEDLKDLISKMGEENTKLSELVEKGKMEVLTLNQLVIKWKRAYQAIVDATQTEELPPVPGDTPRKRVDFTGKAGPFLVKGHTLTDPAFAEVSVEQWKPLRLTIALTKNRDGTFSSLVTADDDDVQTDIVVSAVDPTVLKPRWYQKFWVHGSANFLGTGSAQLGLSYQFERWSVGASCAYSDGGVGCGALVGFRLFR